LVFCFHRQVDLIDTQAHPAGYAVDDRPLPVQPRLGDAAEFSKPGNHRDFSGIDREKASERDGEKDKRQQSKYCRAKHIHLLAPLSFPKNSARLSGSASAS
jgi:hypothetical protein